MNDVKRIAFVTRRFFDLQGLMPAVFGGALIFGALLARALGGANRYVDGYQVLLLAMLATSYAGVRLAQLYRRTFGGIVATRGARVAAAMPLLLVWVGGTVESLRSFDVPWRGPSLAAVALAGVSVAVVVRDWPWRTHHLVPAAAGIAGALVTLLVPAHPDRWGLDPARAEAYLVALSLLGFGVLFAAFMDHRLLVNSLAEAPPAAAAGQLPVHRRLSMQTWLALAVLCPSVVCLWLSDRTLAFALPAAIIAGPVAVSYVAAVVQTVRAFRDLGKRKPASDTGARITFSHDALVACLFVAFATTVAAALFPSQSPALVAASIGICGIWLAVTRPAARRDALIWTALSAVTLFAGASLSPPRAVTILVVAMSAAAALTGLADTRASRLDGFDHVHTI